MVRAARLRVADRPWQSAKHGKVDDDLVVLSSDSRITAQRVLGPVAGWQCQHLVNRLSDVHYQLMRSSEFIVFL